MAMAPVPPPSPEPILARAEEPEAGRTGTDGRPHGHRRPEEDAPTSCDTAAATAPPSCDTAAATEGQGRASPLWMRLRAYGCLGRGHAQPLPRQAEPTHALRHRRFQVGTGFPMASVCCLGWRPSSGAVRCGWTLPSLQAALGIPGISIPCYSRHLWNRSGTGSRLALAPVPRCIDTVAQMHRNSDPHTPSVCRQPATSH